MTNIQEVAELAKVSVATVSRVLNHSDKVTPKTRKKVEDAIKELNYVPNMLARNFRTSKSKSILVILTNISNLFYMEIVHGIRKYANSKGYDILLSETDGELERQIECMQKVKNHIADGAIFLETTTRDAALVALEKKYPVVQCCAYNDDVLLPYVITDNRRGGYMAGSELLKAGRRRLAFCGTDDKSRYNKERRFGFMEAIEKAGIPATDIYTMNLELSFQGGRDAVESLIERKIDGCFFVSDMQAIGAINRMAELGITIPDEISIIGYDNLEICDFIVPALTSISQPARKMGQEAARMLIKKIEKEDKSDTCNIVFEPALVRRDSVKRHSIKK
ncbi:MAG: LacI family DNA-binding transcriptional regulator [Hespellia sp.]|nr:LacI family DNA-binding transcriptional regulator [Hespellia sp.]